MPGVAAALQAHRLVGLDTQVFIYYLEDVSRYADCAGVIFRELSTGSFQGVTSILSLMELAVKPLQLRRPDVADRYEVILSSYPNLAIAQLDATTARVAAELRATHRLRPVDALQVAACLQAGATAFLTNDRDLRRVAAIQVLLLDDFIET